MSITPPVALTIAGVDSGGAAGLAADLSTFAALGVHGSCAVSALTVQDTIAVYDVLETPAHFLAAQIEAVLDDLPVAAVKTGMLASEENVTVVAGLAAEARLPNLVVDPVLTASTGRRLLSEAAERAYASTLLPRAAVITPNLKEVSVLIGGEVPTTTAAKDRAGDIQALCPDGAVVVTGGHSADREPLDLIFTSEEVLELNGAWIETANDHGSGCTFASAVAAGLASGSTVFDAVRHAKTFVHDALVESSRWSMGHGRGPVSHLD